MAPTGHNSVNSDSEITLYCAHFAGKVYTLTLSNSGGKYTLTETGSVDLPGRPSWLTYDEHTKLLYVNDEELEKKEGVLSVLEVGAENKLSVKTIAQVPWAGVASTLYGGENANSFIANAH